MVSVSLSSVSPLLWDNKLNLEDLIAVPMGFFCQHLSFTDFIQWEGQFICHCTGTVVFALMCCGIDIVILLILKGIDSIRKKTHLLLLFPPELY